MSEKIPYPEVTKSNYRLDIDGLRGFQILALIGFHGFPTIFPGGYIGVSIFFVISGYLISTIIFKGLDKNEFNFLDFYSRRIRRIFPSLIAILLFSLIFGWISLLPDEFMQLGKYISGGSLFIDNFISWFESGYFDRQSEFKPLLHLWSLGIEEQFYIFWPFVLWLFYRNKINLLWLTLIVSLISFGLNIYIIHVDVAEAFYAPWTRFWEILFGGILGYFHLYKKSVNIPLCKKYSFTYLFKYGPFFGICILFFGVLFFNKNINYPGLYALLPVAGALLLIGGDKSSWVNRVFLSNKFIVWFGLISYPLYLWHWTLLSFLRVIYGSEPPLTFRIIAVFISIVFSWATYIFIENPIRFGGFVRIKLYLLSFFLIFFGVIGFYVYCNLGLPGRNAIKNLKLYQSEIINISAKEEQCLLHLGIKNVDFDYCRFANAHADTTIAIIGDSHANVAFDGLSEFFSKKSINTLLLGNVGCPPFLGSEYGNTDMDKNLCKKKIEQIYSILFSQRDVKKVVVITLGATYVNNGYHLLQEVSGFAGGRHYIGHQKFHNSLQGFINKINENHMSTFLVTENPELSFGPEQCSSRPLQINTSQCSMREEDVVVRQSQYLNIINNLYDVLVINSTPLFCNGSQCDVFYGGKSLYIDGDHLSNAGSRHLANYVGPTILKQ